MKGTGDDNGDKDYNYDPSDSFFLCFSALIRHTMDTSNCGLSCALPFLVKDSVLFIFAVFLFRNRGGLGDAGMECECNVCNAGELWRPWQL